MRFGLLVALWIVSTATWAAENVATLTITDGTITLIRESTKYSLAEGARLNDEDIVITPANGFAQIEFSDGLRLEVGPGSRLMLAPKLAKDKLPRPARVYVMQGWLKMSLQEPTVKPATPAVASYAGEQADLISARGVTVTHMGADLLQVFVESGEAKVVDRRNPTAVIALRSGEFLARKAQDKTTVVQRPLPDFLAELPRPFRDSLPSRAARFADRPVAPKTVGPIAYEDVADWLQADGSVRKSFVARWRSLAQDKGFRAGLIADLRAHPEWDRVLYPEKYLPKKPSPPAARAPAAPIPAPTEK